MQIISRKFLPNLLFVAAAALIAAPRRAYAVPIKYTLSFVGHGTVGMTSYSGPIAVSFFSDTDAIVQGDVPPSGNNDPVSYSTASATSPSMVSFGGATYQFNADTFTAFTDDVSGFDQLELSNSTGHEVDTFFPGPAFNNLAETTNGPTTNSFDPNTSLVVASSYSDLSDGIRFDDYSPQSGATPVTYEASYAGVTGSSLNPTPEPSSIALLATGLLSGVGLLRRRRRASTEAT